MCIEWSSKRPYHVILYSKPRGYYRITLYAFHFSRFSTTAKDTRESQNSLKLLLPRERVEKLAIKPTTTSISKLSSFASFEEFLFLLLPFSNLVQMLFQHLKRSFVIPFLLATISQRQFVRCWLTFRVIVLQWTRLVVFSRDRTYSSAVSKTTRVIELWGKVKNISRIRKIGQD